MFIIVYFYNDYGGPYLLNKTSYYTIMSINFNSPYFNPEDFTFRELFRMGYYNIPQTPVSSAPVKTRTGRTVKPTQFYSRETFTKGSGAALRPGCDGTDMGFEGGESS